LKHIQTPFKIHCRRQSNFEPVTIQGNSFSFDQNFKEIDHFGRFENPILSNHQTHIPMWVEWGKWDHLEGLFVVAGLVGCYFTTAMKVKGHH
jgi:hypothetical protein